MKYSSFLTLLIFSLCVATFASCKDNKTEATEETKIMTPTGEAVSAHDSDAVMTPEKLKSIYPATLAGLTLADATAQQNDKLGALMTTSEASYTGEGKKLALLIFDTGGNAGLLSVIAPWAKKDVSSEKGGQKTTMIDGNIAYEREMKEEKSAQLLLIYKERYLLSFSATGMDLKELHGLYHEVKSKI